MASRFGFLSDEERLAERGPAAVTRVRRALARGGTAQLFRAAHLLSLALYHARRLEAAAEVSRSAVDCGRRIAARPGQAAQMFHVLRPQIDLLCIEGRVGDPDLALAGLSGLDDLAAGRPAQVGAVTFDELAVSAALEAGYPLPAVAGTARMVDTCKILLRHGRHAELLAFAERYPLGGGLVGELCGGGLARECQAEEHVTASVLIPHDLSTLATCAPVLPPGHAAEAPWLVCPLDLPTPDPRDLPDLPRDQARLGFAQAVHTAAAADPPAAGRLVRGLTQVRDLLNAGPWLSELTPVRCMLSLAETAARLGLDGIVRTLALEARADAACAGDRLLAAEADALLKGLPRPAPEPFDLTPEAGPDSFDAVAAAVLERLAEWGRGESVG
jgi:hypothetical protein